MLPVRIHRPRPSCWLKRQVGAIPAHTVSRGSPTWGRRLLLAAGASACVAVQLAQAAENGGAPYPPGAGGPYTGGIPHFPGLYLLNQINLFSLDRLVGPTGDKLPVPFHGSGAAEVARILYVYPITLPGNGVLATEIVPVATNLNLRAGGFSQSETGVSSFIVSPLIGNWQINQNIRAGAGFDVAFPVDRYRANALTNVSPGYISFQPVLTARYDDPNGLSVGIQPRFAINTQNNTTKYRSGSSFEMDFGAGWNFGKWQPGIVGGVWHQFTDDKLNGSSAPFNGFSGNRGQILNFGPSILYSNGPLTFNVNYQHGFFARNTARSDTVWLNVTVPLGLLASKLFK